MQTAPAREWNGFWSLSSGAIILAWVYFTVFALFQLAEALNPNAGALDLWNFLLLGMFFAPPMLIPYLLIRAARNKQHLRLRRILPWLFRIVYISVIFALCDCLWVTNHRTTIFSRRTEGGSGIKFYTGFGYDLGDIWGDGHYGPEIWFWFAPVVIDFGRPPVHVRWLWSDDRQN